MSEVKVDTISERTAANGVAVDGVTIKDSGLTIPSGGTLTVASGGTITNSGTATGFGGDNTPAFQARLSADQSISDDTYTLIECDTEDFDTDSAYDNTTDFDFTVPVGEGGKYFVYGHLGIYGGGGYDSVKSIHFQCRVNAETSSTASIHHSLAYHNSWNYMCDLSIQGILTLSAGDTVKWYAYGDEALGNNMVIEAKTGDGNNIVGAYKMVGL